MPRNAKAKVLETVSKVWADVDDSLKRDQSASDSREMNRIKRQEIQDGVSKVRVFNL